ncbi:accessory gene regulator ArgB-like protein [Cohnella hongkongensis]|uniref:Accessory gene regulator ArgB-like protein n=1 Tax=Cohnella hongkongensis TaxID=178337 RepID=A0ABV9FCC2_9BACL
MINKLSNEIAGYLKKQEPENTPSIAVMAYSLYIILHAGITIFLILIVSLFLDTFVVTAYTLLYFIVLRFFAGGYHLHSSKICTVLSVLLICAAPLIRLPEEWLPYLIALNLLFVLIYAPRNIKGYARIPEKYYPYMKLVSLAIVAGNFYWMDASLIMVSLFHAILLIPKQEGGK